MIKKLIKKENLELEEKIILESFLSLTYKIWESIVIKQSNKKINELNDKDKSSLKDTLTMLDVDINRINKISDCDKIIVLAMGNLCIKLKNIEILNKIYKRTKNALPMYFYPNILINSFLKLDDTETAIEITENLLNKHYSYNYFIVDGLTLDKYVDYPGYYNFLVNFRYICIANILKAGEDINLLLSKGDILEISKHL